LLGSIVGSGLPEQLLLLILKLEDVQLVLVLILAVFIFFDLVVILVKIDLFDVTLRCFLSPSRRCGAIRLWLRRGWFRSRCRIISRSYLRCSRRWLCFVYRYLQFLWWHDKLEQQPRWAPMSFEAQAFEHWVAV
jgi:hypothetical protein